MFAKFDLHDELNDWISKLPKRDDRKSCCDVSELLASRAFWMAVKEYVRLLTTVHSLLREVDGNKCIVGKMYNRMSSIDEHFGAETSSWLAKDDLNGLQKAWVSRWDYMHSASYSAAYVVDPEFVGHTQMSNEKVAIGFREVVRNFSQ